MATSTSPGLVGMAGLRAVDVTRGSDFAKQNRVVRPLASAFPVLSSISYVAGIAGSTSPGCRAAFSALAPEIHRRPHQHRATCTRAAIAAVAQVVEGEEQKVPLPVVHIDQHSDPDSTIVELSFGDRLGALLDTTKALKNLGLSVVKAQVTTEGQRAKNKFYITRSDNGSKVVNPETLEAIRLTVINNLLKYHPESSEQLYLGETFGDTPPKQKLDVDIATHVSVRKVSPKASQLIVETADRPGLLLDIISVVTDINITVESADINTEGLVAIDEFILSYGGAALSKSLEEVVVNCLRYHIRKVEVEDDSY